jgi:hypothetical protein
MVSGSSSLYKRKKVAVKVPINKIMNKMKYLTALITVKIRRIMEEVSAIALKKEMNRIQKQKLLIAKITLNTFLLSESGTKQR